METLSFVHPYWYRRSVKIPGTELLPCSDSERIPSLVVTLYSLWIAPVPVNSHFCLLLPRSHISASEYHCQPPPPLLLNKVIYLAFHSAVLLDCSILLAHFLLPANPVWDVFLAGCSSVKKHMHLSKHKIYFPSFTAPDPETAAQFQMCQVNISYVI